MNQAIARTENATPLEKSTEGIGAMLKARERQFVAALPKHIPVERFMRVVLTAIQNNPKLKKADQASLFTSCVKAAQDGLLPDGREGALVIYSSKVNGQWVDFVQWMPMIAGIRKKVRNSGDISTWDAVAVRAKDQFEFEMGSDRFLRHKPYLARPLPREKGEKDVDYQARLKEHMDPGQTIAFYSIAKLKTGEVTFDVMSRADVEYVRDTYSRKNQEGNFSPAWVKSFDEMGKKTVARRHAKTLPMSTDLDDLLRRDDALYDLEGASDKALAAPAARRSVGDRIDALIGLETGKGGGAEVGPTLDYDPETGELATESKSEHENRAGDGEIADPATAVAPDQLPAAKGAGDGAGSSSSAAESPAPQNTPRPARPVASDGGDDRGRTNTPQTRGAGPGANLKGKASAALTALLQRGEDAASRGTEDLRTFIENLTGDEQALLSGDLSAVARWQRVAGEMDAAAENGV